MPELTLDLNRYPALHTTRGSLNRTAFSLGFGTPDNFLRYIDNKHILDLGSGKGGLEEDVRTSQNDNLQRRNRHPELQHKPTPSYSIVSFDIQPKKDTAQRWRHHQVAGDWEAMPFADKQFDLIVGTGGYIFYNGTYSARSFEELLRILKLEGVMRLGEIDFPLEVEPLIPQMESFGCTAEIQIPYREKGRYLDRYLLVRKLS